MVAKRFVAVIGILAVCIAPIWGCGKKDDMVDAPLIKNAPPPPPRPDKPILTPSGAGGSPTSGTK